MISYTIFIILSFFLEGIFSNYFLFSPFFFMTTLMVSYPFFQKAKKTYFILSIVFTIFYDIVYTGILFWTTFLFLLIDEFILKRRDIEIPEFILAYVLYHFLTISLLFSLKIKTNFLSCYEYAFSSFPINLLFTLLLFFIARRKRFTQKLNY